MKKKLLFIFALLCTVAQGAWAETINLSSATADVTANDGDVLTGTTSDYRVTIAGDATVTLSGVTIKTVIAFIMNDYTKLVMYIDANAKITAKTISNP